MKNAIYWILIGVLAACNSANPKPERKIKEIRVFESEETSENELGRLPLEQKSYNRKGQLIYEMFDGESGNEYSYDSKGRKIKDVYILHSQCSSISKFYYLANDSISKIEVYEPNRKLNFTIHVRYNKAGINDKDVCINANGSVRFWDEYTYDRSGNQKQWIRYNPDSTVQSKVIYEYNNQNQDIKHTCSGELGGTYSFKYNKKGLKSSEKAYNTDDKQFLWLKVYNYDKSDKIIKIREYNNLKDYPEHSDKTVCYEYKYW